ncbi:hypothetical protein NEIPOLOT_01368 [Neisseria polysaccharea ATCC 43768]|nr:hypothetical protein NEIPOLOT_01368 [Neisseria polysaccharea ATCC 43768]
MIQIKHDFKQKLWSSIRDYIAFPRPPSNKMPSERFRRHRVI